MIFGDGVGASLHTLLLEEGKVTALTQVVQNLDVKMQLNLTLNKNRKKNMFSTHHKYIIAGPV